MSITGVSPYTSTAESIVNDVVKSGASTGQEESAIPGGAENATDSYEKGEQVKPVTYKPDKAMLAQLNASQRAYVDGLQTLVRELVSQVGKDQQSNGLDKFLGNQSGIDPSKVESYWDLLVDNGDGTFSFHPSLSVEDQEKLIAKAKEDISEDGYWGVKQTSQRIVDFAKAITGGDPSKIDDMRKMAQEAFDSAKELAGGELPELSKQTYDAVMAAFDEWEQQAANS